MAAGRAMRSSSKGTVALLNAQGGRMPEQSNDYRVAVFGAGGVGKSSIVLRFVKGTFQDNYVPTIEDTYRQVINCNKNNVCTLQITDTTGSHQFPAMQRLSIAKGHAFILVYSITSRQSLEELKPIVDMIREVKGDETGDVPVVLAANKMDEDSHREVSKELGQTLAKKWGCGFVETSAKTDANIKELFQQLLTLERRRNLNLSAEESEKGSSGGKKGGGGGGGGSGKCDGGSDNGTTTAESPDSKKGGSKKGGSKCSLM